MISHTIVPSRASNVFRGSSKANSLPNPDLLTTANKIDTSCAILDTASAYSSKQEATSTLGFICTKTGQYLPALMGDTALVAKRSLQGVDPLKYLELTKKVGNIGSLGNALTGLYLVVTGVQEKIRAARLEDAEGALFSGIKISIGAFLGSGGALSIASVLATTKSAAAILGKVAGPMYLLTSLTILLEGTIGLHQLREFRREYLGPRAKKSSAKDPTQEELLYSLSYLQKQVELSPQERQKYAMEEWNNYEKEPVFERTEESTATKKNVLLSGLLPREKETAAQTEMIDFLEEVESKLHKVFEKIEVENVKSIKRELIEQKLLESVFEKRHAKLQRRFSPSLLKKLSETQTADYLLSRLEEKDIQEKLIQCVQNNESVPAFFAKLRQSSLGKIVEDLQSGEIDESTLQQALKIDRSVRKSNAQKLILHGLVILAALIGIVSFAVSTFLSGGLIPIITGIALGVAWTIIDSSLGETLVGQLWNCYDPDLPVLDVPGDHPALQRKKPEVFPLSPLEMR